LILTTEEVCDLWMRAPWDETKTLQRPLPTTRFGSLREASAGRWTDNLRRCGTLE
jgi:putative SOS response-associated peptidase YedK